MADQSIIEKIRALRAKVNDAAATEAEVEAAARAITKLMMKYDVSEDALKETAESKGVHAKTDEHVRDLEVVIGGCWQGIQALTETKIYSSSGMKGKSYGVIGAEPDVEMTLYLIEMITISAKRMWLQYRAAAFEGNVPIGKYSRKDYYAQFGYTMNDRMHQLAQERVSVRTQATGTALVVVKDQLIKDTMKEMGLKLRKSRGKNHRPNDRNAINAANNDAQKVNLNRPFQGTNNNVRIA